MTRKYVSRSERMAITHTPANPKGGVMDRAKDSAVVAEEGDEVRRLPEAVEAVSTGRADAEQADEALAWLLSDEGGDGSFITKVLELNIAGGSAERWIKWTIRSVDRDVLRSIQRAAAGNRSQRRQGNTDPDAGEANLRIVANATIAPDLDAVVARKGIGEAPDPMYARITVLRHRFRDKPGLIDQIAGEVLDLSGYDDEDVRESQEVKAAGN